MKITARIDNDFKCLNRYFHKMLDVLNEEVDNTKNAPLIAQDTDAVDSQMAFYGFSHFIKPDMIINIYSFLEFWLKIVCNYQKMKNDLSLSYRDIKGNNDLHCYHKYLTDYVKLNIDSAKISYDKLDILREIRNNIIHSGGHVSVDKEKKFEKIQGVIVAGSLMVFEDDFIFETLEHAKKYLYVAAQA